MAEALKDPESYSSALESWINVNHLLSRLNSFILSSVPITPCYAKLKSSRPWDPRHLRGGISHGPECVSVCFRSRHHEYRSTYSIKHRNPNMTLTKLNFLKPVQSSIVAKDSCHFFPNSFSLKFLFNLASPLLPSIPSSSSWPLEWEGLAKWLCSAVLTLQFAHTCFSSACPSCPAKLLDFTLYCSYLKSYVLQLCSAYLWWSFNQG